MSKTRIAFIGAGNMAASLIGGLRAKGLDAAQIRASDPGVETRTKVAPNTASKYSPTTPTPFRMPTSSYWRSNPRR